MSGRSVDVGEWCIAVRRGVFSQEDAGQSYIISCQARQAWCASGSRVPLSPLTALEWFCNYEFKVKKNQNYAVLLLNHLNFTQICLSSSRVRPGLFNHLQGGEKRWVTMHLLTKQFECKMWESGASKQPQNQSSDTKQRLVPPVNKPGNSIHTYLKLLPLI